MNIRRAVLREFDQDYSIRESAPRYLVPDHVRVRQEDFGLLFYDTRSTRLTFIRSGDLLIPPAFTGEGRVMVLRGASAAGASAAEGRLAAEASSVARGSSDSDGTWRAAVAPALGRLLDDLVTKGLLVVDRE